DAIERGADGGGPRGLTRGQASGGDGGDGGGGRGPRHLAGQVLRRVIRVSPGGRELLGGPLSDAGVGRCDGDGLEGGGGDRQHGRTADPAERGIDGGGARALARG